MTAPDMTPEELDEWSAKLKRIEEAEGNKGTNDALTGAAKNRLKRKRARGRARADERNGKRRKPRK